MRKFFPNPHEIARARTALAAVEQGPTAEDLAEAPILSQWCPVNSLHASIAIMAGVPTAHPILGTGRAITTSPILAIDPDHRWIRTLSRWYRLDGACAPDAVAQEIGVWPVLSMDELNTRMLHTRAIFAAELQALDAEQPA